MGLRVGPSLYEDIRKLMPFIPSYRTQKKYRRNHGILSGMKPGLLKEQHLTKALTMVTHSKEVPSYVMLTMDAFKVVEHDQYDRGLEGMVGMKKGTWDGTKRMEKRDIRITIDNVNSIAEQVEKYELIRFSHSIAI